MIDQLRFSNRYVGYSIRERADKKRHATERKIVFPEGVQVSGLVLIFLEELTRQWLKDQLIRRASRIGR